MLDELSRWRLRPVGDSIDLVNIFLKNCNDNTTAERIGLAILEVVKESSARM